MHELVNGFGSRCAVRLALAGVTAALLAGCSADATRFSGDPLGNPFNSASGSTDKSPVASIQHPAGQTYATAQASPAAIESRPLAPPAVARYSAPSTPNPPLVAQNSAAAHPGAEVTATSSTETWSAVGGTPIVVAQGETAGVLAARYGVPTDALLRANGFSSAAEVHPGTRLVIPVYSAAATTAHPQRLSQAAPQAAAKERILPTRTIPAPQVAARAPAGGTLHFVKGPQPAKLAAKPAAPSPAKPSRSAAAKGTTKLVADKGNATKPQKSALVDKPATTDSKRQVADLRKPTPSDPKSQVADVRKPAPTDPKRQVADLRKPASVDTTTTGSLPPAANPVAPAAPADTANPEFRWPAHGRIIEGFNAGGNDGINIAVPEGTAVKAVEDGVVAYAGDELKGYGKLVLIRHSNGFVSAYADNQDLMVKRGDTVKRGQVIAKSGQTGNVASPQLHFELRKGSTPVDPTQYLAGL
jgi:murein DD-endopeptidase MepM/ murein hydrolase activator NlpD